MSTIDDKQYATATWLAAQVRDADPGPTALWNLAGAVGAGKSSVLRKVCEVLEPGLVPIMASAPGDQVDAAAIALIEMASQLQSANLLDGEMATLSDVSRSWPDKLGAVTGAIERNAHSVVILCDEPTRWYHRDEALLDDTPDYPARSLAEWIAKAAPCRRIIAGRLPGTVMPRVVTKAPRLEDSGEFLASGDAWNDLISEAGALLSRLPMPLSYPSIWQVRLLVALGQFKSPNEVARQATSDISANVLLEELLDLIERDPSDAFKTALIRLSLARTPLEKSSFEALAPALSAIDREVIRVGLCESVGGHLALHPLVRQEVVKRERDPKRWEMNRQWRISPDNRRAVHRQLREVYSEDNGDSLRSQLESLHHEVLGESTALPEQDERLRFDYQLHEIGRTLSYVFRDHRRAAEIFRFALRFNPQSAYSHHYLAFNLDWLAEKPIEVEEHYKKATELQPTHPWWWSRWISYLATRSQIRDARFRWREALDAMSISSDDSPRWIFMSLHRWVARWLLHWAELDFAEEVLRSIPPGVSDSETSIQAEWDLLKALREAERDAAVFPLSVPARDWWAPMPHTKLPRHINGDQLRSWKPARVEAVDRENSKVSFLAAQPRESSNGPIDYEEIQLPLEKVKAAAYKFRSTELTAGMYVEFAYYGIRKRLRIGLHRDSTWNDSRLLPLVPTPDRWYQRAVSTAWDSLEDERAAQ